MNDNWPMWREWELTLKPFSFELSPNEYGLRGEVEVQRTAEFDLQLACAGHPSPQGQERIRALVAGTIAPRIDLGGVDGAGSAIACERIAIGGLGLTERGPQTLIQTLGIRRRPLDADRNVIAHTEWFAGGPTSSVIYPVGTTRRLSLRANSGGAGIQFDAELQTEADGMNDSCPVTLGDTRFTIRRVPSWVGVDELAPAAIDFRSADVLEPDNTELRRAISEAVAFFTGRQLLSLGWTRFGGNASEVESYARMPWGGDPTVVCLTRRKPPAPLGVDRGEDRSTISGNQLSEALATYLPSWSEIWNDLNVTGALWKLWISRRLPLGPNLPLLWAALETLATAWYTRNESRSRGLWTPATTYAPLVAPVHAAIDASGATEQLREKLHNKVNEANSFGSTARLRTFFDEIALPVGNSEWAALRLRHAAAHGGGDANAIDLVPATGSIETLIHRVILKLLGWTGQYRDYGKAGWPDRTLDEPGG